MSKRILIITGDGGESYETWFAVQRFQEAGYEAHVAAPSKRRLHLVMHDFEPGWDTYKESPGYAIDADLTFDDVRVADYEAVMCIGGRAPEYLRNDTRVLAILREFDTRAEVDLLDLPRHPARRGGGPRQGQAIHVLRARAARGRGRRRAVRRRREHHGRPAGVVAHVARAPGVLPRRLRLPAAAASGVSQDLMPRS